MRVYRVARLIAATGGMSLAIVAGTTEAITSTAGIEVVSGFRAWMVALIVIAVVSVCTAVIVERQAAVTAGQQEILDLLDELTTGQNAKALAERDYDSIERRLRSSGDITTLYPEKE